jgi:hypothetical protein
MNNYTLLYYPDFHPDPVWLRKILLLADNVTRIIPDVALRDLDDPDDLLALQDSNPGCLSVISPEKDDVSVESDNMPRLKKAFALLAQAQGRGAKTKVEITLSNDGSVSIAGHVFLHSAKVSPFIYEELGRNALMLSGFEDVFRKLSGQEFIAVEETAADLILSAIAEKISRRKRLDAITDKPIPFVVKALNDLGHIGTRDSSGLEGLVLSSLASVLIPTEVGTVKPNEYREIRESYAPIRNAFKELTADLAQANRLHRIQDPQELRDAVQGTAQSFVREYDTFRKSSYAKAVKSWAPLYVGGLLSIVGTIVVPHVKIALAGVSFGFQILHKLVYGSTDQSARARVFNMLAGVEKDIIRQSGIKKFF